MKAEKIKETALYEPVKDLLTQRGLRVRGEVCACDIAAYGEAGLVIVELKTHFNLELLLQCVDRQRYGDAVYAAIPSKKFDSRMTDILRVLRRLGIGLMLVDVRKRPYTVKEVLAPSEAVDIRRRPGDLEGRRRIIREITLREEDLNTGASVGVELYTAYKLAALKIAEYIRANGPQKAADLKAATGEEKAWSIVYNNPMGWFRRVEKGIYGITDRAKAALDEYHGIIAPAGEEEWTTDDGDY